MPDDVHGYFGLTYANYLVVPRSLLQSMPEHWQHRFVECLEELHAHFDGVPQAYGYQVSAVDANGKYTTDPVPAYNRGRTRIEGTAPPRQEYVVGFLMTDSRVALVRKNRPEWQAGLLNGIGGKVKPGEDPAIAMSREFEEEAGERVDPNEWEYLLWLDAVVEERPAGIVHFFRAFTTDDVLDRLETATDEPIEVVCIEDLDNSVEGPTVPNLYWLIRFAAYRYDRFRPFRLLEESTMMKKPGR